MPSDSKFRVTATHEAPDPSAADLAEIATALNIASLNAVAGRPAQFSVQNQADIIANTNLSQQNAAANQQALSQLQTAVLGKTAARVQELDPLTGRSSVQVLTDNAVADAVAALKAALQGGGGGGPLPIVPSRIPYLRQLLRRVLERIAEIITVNSRLQGDGTYQNPYRVEVSTERPQLLYVNAPVSIKIANTRAADVNLESIFTRS